MPTDPPYDRDLNELDSSPGRSTYSLSNFEHPPERIGLYLILQQIGEGGMGVIYIAEQEEPVRRRVALKIIKLGMDTKEVIGRFEAERQALALMDHPNIATVFQELFVHGGHRMALGQ
jgi:serine/threonine protein kinase